MKAVLLVLTILIISMFAQVALIQPTSPTASPSSSVPSSGLSSSDNCVYPSLSGLAAIAYIGGSPGNVTFTVNAGDQLIVTSNAIYNGSLDTFTVSDSEGSVYSVISDTNLNVGITQYTFYAWKVTAAFSETDTIQVAWNNYSVNDSIVAYDVSGGYGVGFGSEVIGSDPIISVSAPICSIALAAISEVGSPTWGGGPYPGAWTEEISDNSYGNEYVESDLNSTAAAPPGWVYTSYPSPAYNASYIMAEVGYVGGPIPAPEVPSGIFSTLCGSWNDRNASECNPGAPNGTAFYFPPASANLYDTASPGYVQVNPDQYDTTPAPHESYLNYDGTLWLYYGGTWYNWTSSALDSTIDAAVNTPPLCKYTCFSEIDSVAVTYVPSYVTFGVGNLSIIVSWYNVSCPGYPTSGCYDPNQVDNESDWLTVITSNVDLSSPSIGPNFGSASVATLSGKEVTYPDGGLYPKRPFYQNGCGTGTSAAYDPARGLAYFSFEESGCLFAVWFSIDTTGVINDVNTSVGFAGLAIYAPRTLVYDPPDEALLSGNDTYLYILNSTGTWTNTTQAFSLTMNSRTDHPYLSGPTTYGALFIGLNTKTDIWLFSYAYTGGQLVKVPIEGPVPPYPIGAHDYGFAFQGGTYDNEGLVTLMVGCAHWVNSYGGYCSVETFSNATYLLQIGFLPAVPTIVSIVAPVNQELDVTLSLPSAGSLPYTNATLYYGTSCSSLTGLSAITEGYAGDLSSTGFTWNVYGLANDTTYCFAATLWNILGQGPASPYASGKTLGPPPAPTILSISQSTSIAPTWVDVSLPFVFNGNYACDPGCNLYQLVNVTIYYWPSSNLMDVGVVSWMAAPHTAIGGTPDLGLNIQDYTYIAVLGLTPGIEYGFNATVWNVTGESPYSASVNYTTLNSTWETPPSPTHVGGNTTRTTITPPRNTLTDLIILVLSNYQFDGSTYYATASWTNHLNATFDNEFALEGSFLADASNINLTANGAPLTPSHQFGMGNNTLFVFPGAVTVLANGTVSFKVTFAYTPPSPLSTGVIINGNFLSLSQLFDLLAALIIVVISYLSLVMKRVGSMAILGTVLIFLTVGLELFG